MAVITTAPDRRVSRGKPMAALAVSASAAYLAVAIFLNRDVDSYRIDLLRVGGLADVLAALSLAFLCGAIGWAALGRRIGAETGPLSLLGGCVAVGLGCLGTALLGLGWLGLYQSWVLAALVVVFASAVLRHSPGWLHLCGRAVRRLRRLAHGAYGMTWLGIQVIGIGALLLMALAPITDWDSLMYHLDLPIEFLEDGRMFVPADNRHFSFLSPVQLLYLIPLAAGLPQAVNIFTLVGFVFFLLTMVELGQRLCGLIAARVTGLLVWASTSFVLVAVDARVETWTVCLVALTVSWGLSHVDRGDSRWPARVLLGASGGLALAIKVTSMPVVAGIFLWEAVIDYRRRGRVGLAILPAGIAALVWAPWLVKNLLALGDPIFPLLSVRGVDPWLVELGATGAPGIGLLGSARESFSLLHWIVDPGRVTIEGSGGFQSLPWLVALGWVPALLLVQRNRRTVLFLVVLATVQVMAVVGFRSTTNLRYLFPAVVLLTLAGGIGLAATARRSVWVERSVVVLVALSLIGSSTFLIRSVSDGRLDLVLRGVPPGAWLASHDTASLIDLDRFLEDEDAGSAILLFEARGAGFRTPVLQDNVDQTWQAMTTLPLSECPSLGNATHLVVNEWHLAYFASRGVNLDDALWNEFAPYAETCLDFTSEVGPFSIYTVR